jgi:uncharacterized membrane protein YhhN
VIGLLVAEARGSAAGKWVAKPVASTAFVWAALASGAWHTGYGRTLLVGLTLCWCGDILLIPVRRPRVFQAGIAAFLLGHVAFAAAFTSLGLHAGATGAAALAMSAVGWTVTRWLRPHVPADFQVPVRAYVIVICAMAVVAVGAAFHRGAWPIALGALSFVVSDVSVARDRFVKPAFGNRAWGLPLYYLAQLVFALSIGVVAGR